MPFGLIDTPSLALGLLHASLQPLPVRTRQAYFSLDFARRLGTAGYLAIADRWEIGDWVFADAAFPGAAGDIEAFVEGRIRQPPAECRPALRALGAAERQQRIDETVAATLIARQQVQPFLDACVADIDRARPRVVGFTCAFQQRFAAVALARRIKQHHPETVVLLGGAEVRGVPGVALLRQASSIDAIVSGPGDVVFPEVVRRILDGRAVDGLPGVHTRAFAAAGQVEDVADAPSPLNLDDLPFPEFDDFLRDWQLYHGTVPDRWFLSLEAGRGCWWAERARGPCAFCAMNAGQRRHAAKSPARIADELLTFAQRYPRVPMALTDSVLDMASFSEAASAIAGSGVPLTVFGETRVTLTREDLHRLRAAGLATIQSGLESLNTAVLTLMGKGTTALENIQFLKRAREADVGVLWNLLAGMPGEPPGAYAGMARLIPLISHLPPPSRFRFVQVYRSSRLLDEAASRGVQGLTPHHAYLHTLPFASDVIAHLATYFSHAVPDLDEVDRYTADAQDAVTTWRRVHDRSALLWMDDGHTTLVLDRRPVATESVVALKGVERTVHQACARIRSTDAVVRETCARVPGAGADDVRAAIASLERRGLVIGEHGRWLALAQQAFDRPLTGRVRHGMRLSPAGEGIATKGSEAARDGR
jgi:ribosomal peptide maturation radical SAM protein 1